MLLFERRGEEVWLLGQRWPEHVVFSWQFLQLADGAVLHVEGDKVTLTLANGMAVYKVSDWRTERDTVSATLQGGMLHPDEATG